MILNENQIIQEFKSGKTITELAKTYHVATHSISLIIRGNNLPSQKYVTKLLSDKDFKIRFIKLYTSDLTFSEISEILSKDPFFSRFNKKSISKRIYEFANYYNLPRRMSENTYINKYDRIRGYIIRNSKYMAKRRGIEFNLKYTDFEIPEYCPILGIKLEYGSGYNGNSSQHATLDRIDNSKGYIPGNVIVISRLANAMKNQATFDQLELFSSNITKLTNYFKTHDALGNITDIFPN